MNLARPVAELASEDHDLGENELGDASRVAERGVEDGDAPPVRVAERDLVHADAEAAHGEEVLAGGERARGDLRLAADPQGVNAGEERLELSLPRRAVDALDGEPGGEEQVARRAVDVLDEEDPDALGGKCHGPRA